MITRAYQNANGERQEVTLSAAEWDQLTEDDLAAMLGAKKAKPAKAAAEAAPAKVEAEAAPAEVVAE